MTQCKYTLQHIVSAIWLAALLCSQAACQAGAVRVLSGILSVPGGGQQHGNRPKLAAQWELQQTVQAVAVQPQQWSLGIHDISQLQPSRIRRGGRQLQQQSQGSLPLVPGDPNAGDIVLQALDASLIALDASILQPEPYARHQQNAVSQSQQTDIRSSTASSNSRSQAGDSELRIQVTFVPVQNFNVSLRLPMPPRTFDVTVEDSTHIPVCQHTGLVYRDQTVSCQGLVAGEGYTVTLHDSDDEDLQLAAPLRAQLLNSDVRTEQIAVELGMLVLESSFGSLAWAGMYYPNSRNVSSNIIIHAQIVGAQVVLYTRDRPDVIWDKQWTGDEGTANFFVLPGSYAFRANMTVGDTLLSSVPVRYQGEGNSPFPRTQAPQVQQVVAAPQLLCTGEVEDVRGESGTFPTNLSAVDPSKQSVYHPRGFYCRWELLPDNPELTLTVDYSGLLPDEAITLYLGPNNVIQLRRPSSRRAGGLFESTIWVERSIFIEFQTTRSSTSAVGSFSVTWSSISSGHKALLDSRMLVVVLAVVSAAGAVLAALCFYCICCSRRRRGVVVVDASTASAERTTVQRVPSSVRELLPSKPYQPPEAHNPLPGAAVEPDCCSICLVELEAGENVTVLPCMHFYHKDCIGSWLKRNCTCPLCKANVLEAFQRTSNSRQQSRQTSRLYRHRQGRQQQQQGAAGRRSSSSSDASVELHDGLMAAASAGRVPTIAAAHTNIELATGDTLVAAAARPSSANANHNTGRHAPHIQLGGSGSPRGAAGALYGAVADGAVDSPVTGLLQQQQHRTTPVLRQLHNRLPTLHHPAIPAGQVQHSQLVATAAGDTAEQSVELESLPSNPMHPAVTAATNMQLGTVHVASADFAAAAVAAAALMAAEPDSSNTDSRWEGGDYSNSTPEAPAAGGWTGAAVNAAQASVSALRSSSRNWSRRIQGLLRYPASGADGSSSTTAPDGNMPVAADSSLARRSNSNNATAGLPSTRLIPVHTARPAINIYAYAGHPSFEAAPSEQPILQQHQSQANSSASNTTQQEMVALNMQLPGAT